MSLNFGGINIGGNNSGGGGTSNHAQLSNLGYANSGHTGFLDDGASDLTNAGKALISNLGTPSTTYEEIETLASGGKYTATAAGWVAIRCACTSNDGQYAGLYKNGQAFTGGWCYNSGNANVYSMPVSAGEEYMVAFTGYTASNITIKFFYAVGSEHLAPVNSGNS